MIAPQVNTIEDEVAKLATDYKAEEIAFFRAVVRLGLIFVVAPISFARADHTNESLPGTQVDKIMTARKLAYSTPSDEAVRLAKAPITKANAMQLLTSFLANGKPPDLSSRTCLGRDTYDMTSMAHRLALAPFVGPINALAPLAPRACPVPARDF